MNEDELFLQGKIDQARQAVDDAERELGKAERHLAETRREHETLKRIQAALMPKV